MSLTSFIGRKEVRTVIDEIFPKPKIEIKYDEFIEPSKYPSLVGTAFDYLCRFYLEATIKDVQKRRWIAENASLLSELEFGEDSEESRESSQAIVNANERYRSYIENKEITESLLKSCIDLARNEIYFRSGDPQSLAKIGKVYEAEAIEDLKRLYEVIPKEEFEKFDSAILNPSFGHVSALCNGADADLVLDHCLVEIKTVKNISLDIRTWRQLIGYLVLIDAYKNQEVEIELFSEKEKISENGISRYDLDIPKIEKLGVYYSRAGKYFEIPAEIVYENEKYSDFKRWFLKKSKDVFHKEKYLTEKPTDAIHIASSSKKTNLKYKANPDRESLLEGIYEDKDAFKKIHRSPSLAKLLKLVREQKRKKESLANELDVRKDTILKKARKLEKYGLVERVYPKGKIEVEITGKGKKIIERVEEISFIR